MTISDWAIVLATFLGPIFAVQLQKFLEKNRDGSNRRDRVFQTLMATRATRLALEHVAALNSIDLAFGAKKYRKVIEAWRLYSFQLNQTYNSSDKPEALAWSNKDYDLFIDLLYVMSQALNCDFSKEHLQRGTYYPTGHADREADQNKVLSNAARVLAGEQSIKMSVTDFPTSAEALQAQIDLQKKLSHVLDGGALTVQILPLAEVSP